MNIAIPPFTAVLDSTAITIVRAATPALAGSPLARFAIESGDPASASVAARTIVIAILSNTAVMGGMAMFLGSAELRSAMAPAVAATLAVGAAAAALLL